MKAHIPTDVEALHGAAATVIRMTWKILSSPLAGLIMAVADVYDALICKRVYKEVFSSMTKQNRYCSRGKADQQITKN